MANLCGPLDAHLREIEAGLSVRLERRGDDFQVHGPRGQAQRALALLCSLHERAGRPIGARTLQLALAEARAETVRAALAEAGIEASLTTDLPGPQQRAAKKEQGPAVFRRVRITVS